MDQSCESDRELCHTLESLGSLGNFLLFLALASDLDRGDLDLENDLENDLEDLYQSFHCFFEEDLKVLLDREHERLFLCNLVLGDRPSLELAQEIC